MGLLTRAAILAANDIRTERVAVPEWGGDVLVKGLSAGERDAFEVATSIGRLSGEGDVASDLENLSAKLVALAVVDEAGGRLFTEADVADLGRKASAPVNRLFAVAKRLSALSESDVKALEKNSGSAPSGASSSA